MTIHHGLHMALAYVSSSHEYFSSIIMTADGKFLRACTVQYIPMSHMFLAELWDCTARHSTRGLLQHELPVSFLDVGIIGVMSDSQGLPRVQASSTQ